MYRCVLAEEIGHHITGAQSHLFSPDLLQMGIDELNARIWAVNFLVPEVEYKILNKLSLSDKELAKRFRVTKEFIELRHVISTT